MSSLTGPSAELQRVINIQRRVQGIEGNYVFSPFSILFVFAMAMRGASGPTLSEMHSFLKLTSLPPLPKLDQEGETHESASQLDMGTSVFVSKDLQENPHFQKYVKVLQKESGGKTEAKAIDFWDSHAAAQEINDFVSTQTHQRIKELVNSGDFNLLTCMVLVSAMFFKCSWAKPFPEHATKKAIFHAMKGGQKVDQTVDMMSVTLTDSPFFVKADDKVTAIALPYTDPNIMMYIIKPHNAEDLATLFDKEQSKKTGFPYIEEVVRDMNSDQTAQQYWGQEIHLKMPKFKLNAEDNREEVMSIFRKYLGITSMFNPVNADFSKITGDRRLYVSFFAHAAEIQVDEKGTVASAATAMGMMLRMMVRPRTPLHITIDGPFAFQIRYSPPNSARDGSSDYVLFSGEIRDAAAAQ